MDRTEWPTPSRIQALRESGAAAHSPAASACAGLAALILSLAWVKALLDGFLAAYQGLYGAPGLGAEEWRIAVRGAAGLLLAPPAVVAAAVAAAGLVQTRFLVHFGHIRLDFRRLRPGRALAPAGVMMLLAEAFAALALSAAFVLLVWRAAVPAVMALMLNEPSYLSFWAGRLYLSLALPAAGLLLGLAFCAWLAARFRFMLSHRMTRREILAEHADQPGG